MDPVNPTQLSFSLPSVGVVDPLTASALSGYGTNSSAVAPMTAAQTLSTAGANPMAPVTPDAGFDWKRFLGSTFMDGEGGLNLRAVGGLAEGLASLGSLYGAFQMNKLARDSLDFQKKSYKQNLANQTKSYNTALEDRLRTRGIQNGTSRARTAAEIEKHSL